MSSSRLIAAALLVSFAMPCAGARAAIWSPVQAVGPPSINVQDLGILFARDGTALISFRFARMTARPAQTGRLAVRRPNGMIARVQTMRDDLRAPPVSYGADHVALLRARAVPVARNALEQRVRLRVSRGTVAAPLRGKARSVAVFHAFDRSPAAIAVSRDGEVAVAWTQLQPDRRGFLIRVAIERPGQPFGRPRTLATTSGLDATAVALAYDSRNELVIAYASTRRHRRVVATTVRARDGTFGRRQILGPREGNESLAVAAGGRERAVVAWGTQDPGIETSKPWVVRAAVRHGRAFGAAQLLDAGGRTFVDLPKRVAVTMTRGGVATVAWSNAVGDMYPLRVSTSDATGRFGSSTELDASGAIGDLALSAAGTTLLTWTSFHGQFGAQQPSQVRAALRPAGLPAFGAPETLAISDRVGADGPHAAFDPRNDLPAVIWPAVLTAPTDAIHMAVRVA